MYELILDLINLRDEALDECKKWEYDPHLGKTHENYLDKLNGIINGLTATKL